MIYKPDGHTSVSPYLIIDDAEVALVFIAAAFGATPSFIHRNEAGAIAHAEVKIDDSVVMLGQSPGGPDSHVHVYVADPDAVFKRAEEAGGSIVQELTEKGDGDRRGGIRDPAGTTWWIAKTVSLEDRGKAGNAQA